MSEILDGPGAGSHLSLRRAPIFLRVVIDAHGKVDALDQIHDTPAPGETVHVYRCASIPTVTFLDRTDPDNGRLIGTRYESAKYRHLPEIDGTTLGNTTAWQTWCREHAPEGAIDPLAAQPA